MKAFFAFLLTAVLASVGFTQTRDLARWVYPFVGTGGHGHTFPGAVVPFGMVQLSPDTRGPDWDGSSGYHYSDDTIYGFSHTHLSGTGIPDGCDILFMPTVNMDENYSVASNDTLLSTYRGYPSSFSHASEKAEPGYYSVRLDDRTLLVELTATKRVGFHRYTFQKSDRAGIFLDLLWRDETIDSEINIVGRNRIEGFRRSKSWAKDQSVYFVAEFSKSFISADPSTRVDDPKYSQLFRFKTVAGEQILLKVALSSVSIDGARKNLEAELTGWDFDKVRADAKAAWNKELSKIEVSGGTPEQTTTFYTALYHTMIHPSLFSDIDGQYRGLDGKIHQLPGYGTDPPAERRSSASPAAANESSRGSAAASNGRHSRMKEKGASRKSGAFPLGESQNQIRKSEQYTVFSLWDTFRAAHPLYTIIDRKRTVDFIKTILRMYDEGGRLPVWELWGNETDTMIGYHAVPVIADAMAKSIKGFDYEKAYAAAKHSAELDHHGLAAYKKRGYISMEDEQESVSKTLEYAYDDWCISEMASVLYTHRSEKYNYTAAQANRDPLLQKYEKEGDYYSSRAGYYENLFDRETGFIRPKRNGGFVSPFAPNEVTFNFTEGNSWVYSFFVPQDLFHLIALQGGREKFAAKLDELFTTTDKLAGREQPDITGLIGQYAHGNEPSHHIAYLYNYAGEAWKSQKYVRQILDDFYKPSPDGLIGNEDCGQMSAWYVLSASGFYPVTPGDGIYVFGSPLFPEVKYHLENGKTFTIRSRNVSPANKYILSAKLNGSTLDAPILPHDDIMKGGILEFEMASAPQLRAFPSTSGPVSTLPGNAVAVPLIDGGQGLFEDTAAIKLSTLSPDSKIHFTIDGSLPTVKSKTYSGPISTNSTTIIKAITEDYLGRTSRVAEAIFYKKPNDWSVQISSKYNRQYTGGGDQGLIDGIRGTTNFASGEWQGYQGQDFVAVIDLQKPTEIREVGGGFLQVARSWIWMPTRIEFEVSDDSATWRKVAEIKTDVAPEDMTPVIRDYVQKIAPTRARYLRVTARNLGKIPAWHPGAGGEAFIFVDEVIIR